MPRAFLSTASISAFVSEELVSEESNAAFFADEHGEEVEQQLSKKWALQFLELLLKFLSSAAGNKSASEMG